MIPKKKFNKIITPHNATLFLSKGMSMNQQTRGESSMLDSQALYSQIFNYNSYPDHNFELITENRVPQGDMNPRIKHTDSQVSPPPPPPLFS